MAKVKIVYQQTILPLTVAEGCTIEQAIMQSELLQCHPEIDLSKQSVGIYNQVFPLNTVVKEGDRIEIYQPLRIDPKEARRIRALKR